MGVGLIVGGIFLVPYLIVGIPFGIVHGIMCIPGWKTENPEKLTPLQALGCTAVGTVSGALWPIVLGYENHQYVKHKKEWETDIKEKDLNQKLKRELERERFDNMSHEEFHEHLKTWPKIKTEIRCPRCEEVFKTYGVAKERGLEHVEVTEEPNFENMVVKELNFEERLEQA